MKLLTISNGIEVRSGAQCGVTGGAQRGPAAEADIAPLARTCAHTSVVKS